MTDLSVIILTKNEKLHIKRCLERLAPLAPSQIFIVDCFSTDGTQKVVTQYSAEISSCGAEEFRKRAVAKVEEWLEGISEEVFVAALDKLLDEKISSGEYRLRAMAVRLQCERGQFASSKNSRGESYSCQTAGVFILHQTNERENGIRIMLYRGPSMPSMR